MTTETPQPQYQQIADQLREAIERGDYLPGSVLPSEAALAALYDVDRRTINRAIVSLRADGLVHVERGNRTIVRELPVLTRDVVGRQQIRAEGGARGAFQAELARQGLEGRSDVEVSEQQPPEDIAALLGRPAQELALTRARRMYAGDIPVQLATSWLPSDIIGTNDQLYDADPGPGGIYSRLAELGYGPVAFTETVRLRLPTDDERQFLRMDTEQRVYDIRRTATDETGRVVEVNDIVLAAHQWELIYTWLADQSAD
jgi:GntR family transcriptional regulator